MPPRIMTAKALHSERARRHEFGLVVQSHAKSSPGALHASCWTSTAERVVDRVDHRESRLAMDPQPLFLTSTTRTTSRITRMRTRLAGKRDFAT